MVILLSAATFVMTLLGGLLALRLQDRLHLILGFSAGAVIGVGVLRPDPRGDQPDRAPPVGRDVAGLGHGRIRRLHDPRPDDCAACAPHGAHGHHAEEAEPAWRRGALGAASLSIHSLLDGFAIGLAFQVSDSVGAIVAAAVLAHDFPTGSTRWRRPRPPRWSRMALGWLVVDAAAPVVGAVLTLAINFREEVLGYGLGLVRRVLHLHLGERPVARELSRSPDGVDDGDDDPRHGGRLRRGQSRPGVSIRCTNASAAFQS